MRRQNRRRIRLRQNASDMEAAPIAPRDPAKSITWLPPVALFVLTVLVFAIGVENRFVNYDDPDYITANEHIRAGLTSSTARWALTANAASNWHPLTWLSHALDVSVFQMSPAGHHATSILLHGLAAAAAFVALRRLTQRTDLSFVVALLFAVHPLRAESVAWVAERKDVLSGLFFFLTLWAYARYTEGRRAGTLLPSEAELRQGAESLPYPEQTPVPAPSGGPFYAAALVFFALGLMSKPMLVTLPCVLLLLDYWPLNRRRIDIGRGLRTPPPHTQPPSDLAATRENEIRDGGVRRPRPTIGFLVLEKLPFLALSIASSCVTYIVQKQGGAVTSELPWDGRVTNALIAIPRYLGKIAWPAKLAALYPHPGHWPAALALLAVLALLAITAAALRSTPSRPWVLMGWLWYVGMLVPVVGLVQVGLQSIADRYTYLPAVGIGIAAVWTVAEAIGSARTTILGVVGIAVPLSVATVHQVTVWRDSRTLFTQTIAVAGDGNYLAYDNRGIALADRGEVEAAIADYERSLAINPRYSNAHNNLGLALNKLGRTEEAIVHFRAAVTEKPSELEAHNNLANALSDVGRLDEAMAEFRYVLERSPHHVNALNGEAVIYAQRGDLPKAEQQFKRVLEVDPTNLGALTNLGNVYAMTGRREEAARTFESALQRKPDDPVILFNLGQLDQELGRLSDAAEKLTSAARLNPRNVDAHFSLGSVLARLGRRDDAIAELETCLQLQPNHPAAKALLGQLRH